ncbi:uncharacterized protein LTR77_000384 [Saxophila tyrrhenica]|uniref:Uncharacterized protein n=1 Tax=Saxophila tyrrhenica TaxID=1690608 RepID=A0AAV9PN45_9PEZI|nr:hypothetical protein LTR77_000384 [Saxophila tyrrhenica]
MSRRSPPIEVVLDLLAEKDRLVREKDELVESKNKMWREYYDLLQEKDRENDWLREEFEKSKRRSKELETALRDLLDRDDEEEVEEDEEAVVEEVDDGDDGYGAYRTAEEEMQNKHEQQEQESYIDRKNLSQESLHSCNPPFDDVGPGRRFYDGRPAPAPSPPVAMERLQAPRPLVRQAPPPPTRVDYSAFVFAPLIRVLDNREDRCGGISSVAPTVIKSIRSTMDQLEQKQHPGPFESTCCAWKYLEGHKSQAPWTNELPRREACRACFNARRACLLWLGDMKWMVLPLPPRVRNNSTTWRDAEYYIYPGGEDSTEFPGVWRESTQKRKKRRQSDDVG